MKPNTVSRSSIHTLTARECQFLFKQSNMGSYQYGISCYLSAAPELLGLAAQRLEAATEVVP
jgi:hypothetical protein